MEMEVLSPGNYYHVFNRGNNGQPLFFEEKNYFYFLRLYSKYISPVADTYAWCLMKNHFHFLVYLKSEKEKKMFESENKTRRGAKTLSASKQFSHCFNAYAQAINKHYNRTGSLFEKSLERKHVKSEKYFKKLIFYIHNNPVHHGIVSNITEYRWTSYKSFLSDKPTRLMRNEVIEIFEDVENFKYFHDKDQDLNDINNLLLE